MFNDVNFYDNQEFFDQHKYVVVETPERKFYYMKQWAWLLYQRRRLSIGLALMEIRTLQIS